MLRLYTCRSFVYFERCSPSLPCRFSFTLVFCSLVMTATYSSSCGRNRLRPLHETHLSQDPVPFYLHLRHRSSRACDENISATDRKAHPNQRPLKPKQPFLKFVNSPLQFLFHCVSQPLQRDLNRRHTLPPTNSPDLIFKPCQPVF